MEAIDLDQVREQVSTFFADLQDRGGPYGCIRMSVGKRPDLYSSVDCALALTIMGEDLLQSVSAEDRRQWADHINSFAEGWHDREPDGSYFDRLDHGPLHANGQVIGALGVIGGKQKYVNRLYDGFARPDRIGPWLESQVDWRIPWSESHKFWGGLHCFSISKHCTTEWRTACFAWLDANVDPVTGFWRKGTPASERIHHLGGCVHILPIYEHLRQPFAFWEPLADSVLELQQPGGGWLSERNPFSYMDLDALYVFHLVTVNRPTHRRDDVRRAVQRYAETALAFYRTHQAEIFARHPHFVLAAVGIFGLLSRLLPDQVTDSAGLAWTDIFSDPRLYRTDRVERDAH